MRVRAATMSSIVSGSMDGMPSAAELDFGARARPLRRVEDVQRRGEILDRETEGLEEGDVLRVAAPFAAADQQLANFGDDVVRADVAVLERDENITRLFEGR